MFNEIHEKLNNLFEKYLIDLKELINIIMKKNTSNIFEKNEEIKEDMELMFKLLFKDVQDYMDTIINKIKDNDTKCNIPKNNRFDIKNNKIINSNNITNENNITNTIDISTITASNNEDKYVHNNHIISNNSNINITKVPNANKPFDNYNKNNINRINDTTKISSNDSTSSFDKFENYHNNNKVLYKYKNKHINKKKYITKDFSNKNKIINIKEEHETDSIDNNNISKIKINNKKHNHKTKTDKPKNILNRKTTRKNIKEENYTNSLPTDIDGDISIEDSKPTETQTENTSKRKRYMLLDIDGNNVLRKILNNITKIPNTQVLNVVQINNTENEYLVLIYNPNRLDSMYKSFSQYNYDVNFVYRKEYLNFMNEVGTNIEISAD